MTTTQESIQTGEKLLATYTGILTKIEEAIKPNPSILPAAVLLEIEKINFSERVAKIKERLEILQKKHLNEFEIDSKNTNLNIDALVERAKRYIGKEPLGISEKIQEAVAKWEAVEFMEQGEKNELFVELEGHVNFFKKKLK